MDLVVHAHSKMQTRSNKPNNKTTSPSQLRSKNPAKNVVVVQAKPKKPAQTTHLSQPMTAKPKKKKLCTQGTQTDLLLCGLEQGSEKSSADSSLGIIEGTQATSSPNGLEQERGLSSPDSPLGIIEGT